VSKLVKKEVLELKEVEFNNIVLIGVKTDNGIYTSIKKICNDLGLSFASQTKRIKIDDTLKEGVSVLETPSNGGVQEQLFINVDYLPLWLSGIQINKCSEQVRPLLKEFKIRAKDVLAQAFIKVDQLPKIDPLQVEVTQVSSIDVLKHLINAIDQNDKGLSVLNDKVDFLFNVEIQRKKQEIELQEKTYQELQSVEYSTRLISDVPTRKKIVNIINKYVKEKTPVNPEYRFYWSNLWRNVYDRLGYDIVTRLNNQIKKGNKDKKALDIVEDLGLLEQVYDIASSIYKIEKVA
jgi:uncharacterized protein YcfL